MATLPTTGVDWPVSGLNKYLPNRVRKGGLVALLMRDTNGSATDISPGGAFGSPFAQDGFVRNDLLITAKDNTGAPIANQGWYLVGALSPDGPSVTPNITLDETEILQSNEDILAEITKNSADIAFMAYESKAVTDALFNNKPLSSLLDDGAAGYSIGTAADADLIERQILLIRAHKADGLREFTAIAFPRVTLSKLNKRTWNKKTVDMVDVVYKRLLDPYCVDANGVPSTEITWRDGPGWRLAGGSPVIGTVVPTPVTGLKVNLVFPLSGKDIANPTFTATKTTGGTTTPLTLQGSPSIVTVNGVTTVTLVGTGLTATTAYTGLLTVTGDNNAVATAVIPSFTATAS